MKPRFGPRERLEILGLVALVLLIANGLIFYARRRESRPLENTTGNSYSATRIALSPTGTYLAGICRDPNAPANSQNPTIGMQLVVWSVASGDELSRVNVDAESAGRVLWSPDERFVALTGRYAQVFRWKSKKLANDQIARVIGTNDSGKTDLDTSTTYLDLKADVKVQVIYDGQLQAYRLSTGAPILLRWRGRQLAGPDPAEWKMALRPTRPGGPLHAIVVQEEPRPKSRPLPAPPPPPKPAPLTPQQKAYLEKQRVLDAELENIVNQLQADDPPSEEEAARLEARGKAIIAYERAENKRLFPAPAQNTVQKRAPRPPCYARLKLVDLKSGDVFWEKRVVVSIFLPGLSWSPDGSVVALMGMPRKDEKDNGFDRAKGIDFIAAKNGNTLGKSTLQEEVDRFGNGKFVWLPGRVLAIEDRKTFDKNPQLLLLQAQDGKVLEHRPMPSFSDRMESLSVSDDGLTWAFAGGAHGWRAYSELDFKAGKPPFSGYPMPSLTP